MRFIAVPTFAFGHLALEPDQLLKEMKLGQLPFRKPIWILGKQPVANRALLDIWKQLIAVVRVPGVDPDSAPWSRIRRTRSIVHDTGPYITAINATARFGRIQAEWGARSPLLILPDTLREEGRRRLRSVGVADDAWFACIHCRGSGYHAGHPDQGYRDAAIETYSRAIDFIRSQGGWVVRYGDPSMPPLPKAEMVFDYAHSPIRADWMDLFLAAECDYFVGACSGPASVAAAFGRPMAMGNCLPLSATLSYCHAKLGVATPKLLRSVREGRVLTFSEILSSEIGNYRWLELYQRDGLELIDNDEEDLEALARETHALFRRTLCLTPDDQQLQERLRRLFNPGHYGYGSECLLSPAFLRRHRTLLD